VKIDHINKKYMSSGKINLNTLTAIYVTIGAFHHHYLYSKSSAQEE